MINQETRDKIAKLPAWAREIIKRLEITSEPQLEELVRLRKENSRLSDHIKCLRERCEAMTELFNRASIGGSYYAAAIIEVLEGYEIMPPTTPDKP